MSAVRNVALLGCAIGDAGDRVDVLGREAHRSSIRWIVVIIDCRPMRLPMKFGVSFAHTMPLPSSVLARTLSTRALASAEVSGPATSSSSFM